MASNWIKIEVITPDKPEIFKIAEILNLDPDAVLGKMVRLWVWADQQTIDGNAVSVTKGVIDRITFNKGFADALINVGWLKSDEGNLTLPNFERHNGESSKKRALTNRRVAEHRKSGNASVTQDVTHSALQKALPEEEEDNIKENTPYPHEAGVGVAQDRLPRKKRDENIDYQAVAIAFNDSSNGRLPSAEVINDKRKRAIRKLLSTLKEPTAECAKNYFDAFMAKASPFYFGQNDSGWKASFDYLLRPDTLVKTKEGTL